MSAVEKLLSKEFISRNLGRSREELEVADAKFFYAIFNKVDLTDDLQEKMAAADCLRAWPDARCDCTAEKHPAEFQQVCTDLQQQLGVDYHFYQIWFEELPDDKMRERLEQDLVRVGSLDKYCVVITQYMAMMEIRVSDIQWGGIPAYTEPFYGLKVALTKQLGISHDDYEEYIYQKTERQSPTLLLVLNLDLVDKMHLSDISRAYVCAHMLANEHAYWNTFRRQSRVQIAKLEDPKKVYSIRTLHDCSKYIHNDDYVLRLDWSKYYFKLRGQKAQVKKELEEKLGFSGFSRFGDKSD